VELGCGAGLVGLALLPELASLVLTDGNADVLRWAAKNVLINMPADEMKKEEESKKITTQLVVWTEDGGKDAQGEAPLLFSSSSPPSLVLAADVIYDVEVLPPLLATASRLLSQSHTQKKQNENEKEKGRFILSYCGRCLLSDEAFDRRITQVAATYKLKLESITTTTTTTTTMAGAGARGGEGDATTPALLLAGLEPKVVQTLRESNARVYVFCRLREEGREEEEEDGR
jgi:predicted TPR repeat methyltransferase